MVDGTKIAGLQLNSGGSYTSAEPLQVFATFMDSYVYWALGIAALVALVYAGIVFITSGGDSGKVTKAKNILLYTIIGIFLATMAIFIINLMNTELNSLVS